MEPFEPQHARRGIRLTLVSIGLLALLAVVAFSSRGGFGGHSNASPTPDYFSYAFTVFLIVFVLAIPVAVWAFAMQAREDLAPRTSFQSRVIRGVLMVLFLALIAAFAISFKHRIGHVLDFNTNLFKSAPTGPAHGQCSTASKYEPQFKWIVVWIVAGCAAVGVVVLAFFYRRRSQRELASIEPQTHVGEDLAASISDAIDDLEAETDARRAVIAAYARMEGVLARHGLRRTPSETPVEYLQRILLGLTERKDAVGRLTRLFEQAKFSRHEIDSSMKREAIDALRELRDDLRRSVR